MQQNLTQLFLPKNHPLTFCKNYAWVALHKGNGIGRFYRRYFALFDQAILGLVCASPLPQGRYSPSVQKAYLERLFQETGENYV